MNAVEIITVIYGTWFIMGTVMVNTQQAATKHYKMKS